jgi:hypothetical protein
MCCGISKTKLHLQSDMKHTNLLLNVFNEGFPRATILNLVKAMQNSCFLPHSKHAVNFQRHEVLFVKYEGHFINNAHYFFTYTYILF